MSAIKRLSNLGKGVWKVQRNRWTPPATSGRPDVDGLLDRARSLADEARAMGRRGRAEPHQRDDTPAEVLADLQPVARRREPTADEPEVLVDRDDALREVKRTL